MNRPSKNQSPFLIGAHMSIAGGVHKALLEGQAFGANVIQIFTANQRQWHSKAISEAEVQLWEKTRTETGITHIMSHDNYLINLGSAKKLLLEKSRLAFAEEIKRCHQLKIDFLNFHPGAAVGTTEEKCLDTIVESLLSMKKELLEGKGKGKDHDKDKTNNTLSLLIETTAGQGTVIGYKFEQIGYIISRVHQEIPIGVCLDTCHSFAAGYDLRTKAGWEQTLKEFDSAIGLKYLKAFHVNDSLGDLGSRKDRHANLGKGKIGIAGFAAMMQHPKIKYLPKYLETPLGNIHWQDEIKLLQKLGKEHAH